MPTWREYHNHANILSKQYLYGVHQTKYKITKTIKSLCISGNCILFGSKCGSIPTDFKCMMFPPSMASPTVAGHEGLMMPVVSAETVGTGWYHVISRLVPIGKVSAIITHISGKSRDSKTEVWSAHLQQHKYTECSQKLTSKRFIFQTHRAWIIISFHHGRDNGNLL